MNKIDDKILLLFLVYMTTNNKWDEEIEAMKEKQREIKEKKQKYLRFEVSKWQVLAGLQNIKA